MVRFHKKRSMAELDCQSTDHLLTDPCCCTLLIVIWSSQCFFIPLQFGCPTKISQLDDEKNGQSIPSGRNWAIADLNKPKTPCHPDSLYLLPHHGSDLDMPTKDIRICPQCHNAAVYACKTVLVPILSFHLSSPSINIPANEYLFWWPSSEPGSSSALYLSFRLSLARSGCAVSVAGRASKPLTDQVHSLLRVCLHPVVAITLNRPWIPVDLISNRLSPTRLTPPSEQEIQGSVLVHRFDLVGDLDLQPWTVFPPPLWIIYLSGFTPLIGKQSVISPQ